LLTSTGMVRVTVVSSSCCLLFIYGMVTQTACPVKM
jgi:hypothetical protein